MPKEVSFLSHICHNNSFFQQNFAITDDVVKVYRNYVILYSLHDVIKEAAICITGV